MANAPPLFLMPPPRPRATNPSLLKSGADGQRTEPTRSTDRQTHTASPPKPAPFFPLRPFPGATFLRKLVRAKRFYHYKTLPPFQAWGVVNPFLHSAKLITLPPSEEPRQPLEFLDFLTCFATANSAPLFQLNPWSLGAPQTVNWTFSIPVFLSPAPQNLWSDQQTPLFYVSISET